MKRLLFLCTGNYYRSRYAEIYFNWLAGKANLPWQAFSRGLALDVANPGPISRHSVSRLLRHGIEDNTARRFPQPLTIDDLADAAHIVAVKGAEHRRMLEYSFPTWQERVEFWNVHDIDCAPPDDALPVLEEEIKRLMKRLARAAA